MGLGLTISYQLSRKLGKPLHVESIYGQGTMMTFHIRDKVIDKSGGESTTENPRISGDSCKGDSKNQEERKGPLPNSLYNFE